MYPKNVLVSLGKIGLVVLTSAPGTVFLISIGVGASEFCSQYGGIMQCYVISREFALFLRQYSLLIGLAIVDVTVPSLAVMVYSLTRVFKPERVNLHK